MNTPSPIQTQRMMYPTVVSRVPVFAQTPVPMHASSPALVTMSRFVSQQPESVQEVCDSHWAIYAGFAAFCLAATFIISSNAVQRVLYSLIQ